MRSASTTTRRARLGALVAGVLLLLAGHLAAGVADAVAPSLTIAGLCLAAAGGGIPGVVVGVFGAGLSSFDTPLRVGLAIGALVVFERVSRLTDRADKVAEASFVDRLTGLYTYGFFTEALRNEVYRVRRYGGTCSLVVLDLDRFKLFNDEHGHAAGNQLLTRVGEEILRLKRESDVAARFGGEELVVLVPGSARHGIALAERIRESIESLAVSVGGRRLGTTVSAGVAEYPTDARNARELFAAADAALYMAKRNGRNQVRVASGEQVRVERQRRSA